MVPKVNVCLDFTFKDLVYLVGHKGHLRQDLIEQGLHDRQQVNLDFRDRIGIGVNHLIRVNHLFDICHSLILHVSCYRIREIDKGTQDLCSSPETTRSTVSQGLCQALELLNGFNVCARTEDATLNKVRCNVDVRFEYFLQSGDDRLQLLVQLFDKGSRDGVAVCFCCPNSTDCVRDG